MKSIRLTAVRRLETIDLPRPVPADGEALVAVKTVGICGSDIHFYNQGRIGADQCRFPQALGHEPAGVVVSAPDGSGLKAGDRVAVEPARPCYTCEFCVSGHYNVCPNVKFLASPGMQGALQEFIAVDPRQLARIPDAVSFDEAALIEPLGVAYHTALLSKIRPVESVAIFGAGSIGLLTLAVLKACGAGETFIFDRLQYRLDFAVRHFSADHAVNTTQTDPLRYIRDRTGGGVHLSIEAAGVQETIGWSYEAARIRGRVLVVGIPEVDAISFNPHTARRKELLVQNVRRSNRSLEPCIELVTRKTVNIAPLATHHFPLDRTVDAFETAGNYRDGVIKAIVTL